MHPKQGTKADSMSETRKQVATFLEASQQGELLDLNRFLETYAAAQLADERAGFSLAPGDASDDDDYPEGHFTGCPGGKKPIKAARLLEYQHGACRDFKDGNGRTALHFAASSNAQGVDAVANRVLELAPLAHGFKDDNGATPIILAAAVGGVAGCAARMVRLLLEAGADPAAADKDGVQAAHHAAAQGHVDVLQLLHAKGAPLNVASGAGNPLHWASGEGQGLAVQALVALGAPLDAPNAQGLTPILMAAAAGQGRCVAVLARAGADAGHLLGGGLTVLHVCADLGLADAVAALLETLVGRAAAARADATGSWPVHLAAAAGHRATVELLQPLLPAANRPSVDELLAAGTATAARAERDAANALAAAAAQAAAPSPLLENTAPASSEIDAKAAQACKDAGNLRFVAKEYADALQNYTAAVRLDGTDPVFFSNRSACYLELAKQHGDKVATAPAAPGGGGGGGLVSPPPLPDRLARALADAEHCRRLKPDWSKGCFRLAAARMACGLYEDAAVAAFEGLKLDDTNASLKKIMKEAVAKGREALHGSA
jgi:ankyrin repeat protein